MSDFRLLGRLRMPIEADDDGVVAFTQISTAMQAAADRIEQLTAERDLLRGACEGAVNWLDALLHQVQSTSCEPDDPEAFDEVLMGAGMFMEKARAALRGETP